MHKAIQDNLKTVTRRLDNLKEINQESDGWRVELYQGEWQFDKGKRFIIAKPRYHAGEIVYIKEAWALNKKLDLLKIDEIVKPKNVRRYFVDDPLLRYGYAGKWRSPFFMPEWAARDFIKILQVRVERLQAITDEDAIAEGCRADKVEIWWQGYRILSLGDLSEELMHQQVIGDMPPNWMIEPHRMLDRPDLRRSARQIYVTLWDSINPKFPWASNPYCWRYQFDKYQAD